MLDKAIKISSTLGYRLEWKKIINTWTRVMSKKCTYLIVFKQRLHFAHFTYGEYATFHARSSKVQYLAVSNRTESYYVPFPICYYAWKYEWKKISNLNITKWCEKDHIHVNCYFLRATHHCLASKSKYHHYPRRIPNTKYQRGCKISYRLTV